MNKKMKTQSAHAGKKPVFFKDELRQSLIVHSLVPIAVITFAFLFLVYFGWQFSLEIASKTAVENCAEKTESLITACSDFLSKQSSIDIKKITADSSSRVALHEKLYAFCANQHITASFYLLDSQYRIPFSFGAEAETAADSPVPFLCRHYLQNSKKDSETVLYYPETEPPCLYLLRKTEQKDGFLCFALRSDAIPAFLGELPFFLIITNQFGRIYAENTALFTTGFSKLTLSGAGTSGFVFHAGQWLYVKQAAVKNMPLIVYTVKNIQYSVMMFCMVGGAVMLIFVLVSISIWMSAYTFALKKTKLIDTVVDAFEKSGSGDLTVRLDMNSPEEFAAIGRSYNTMQDNLQKLIRTNEEQMQQAILLNLKQMESQFHAHFLFNTLETIRFMSRIDPEAIEKIIVSLSNLLRYSITGGKETVLLKDDLRIVKDYLAILSYRFGKRLRYTMNIPEDIQSYRVPKLIFQPIIENSIKYDLEEHDAVTINIEAYTQRNNLYIAISDDGPGIEAEILRKIERNLQTASPADCIGLYNVHRRLVLLFGEAYGIKITAPEGEGTRVLLSMPLCL